jgi:hypothetical protein
MTVQRYLTDEEVVDLLLSELPGGVYPTDRADDPDKARRSYSSSELRAHSVQVATVYDKLRTTALNKSITDMTLDGVSDWEKMLFKDAQNASLPLETRRQNLLSKYRATGGISYLILDSVVHGILDAVGLAFQLAARSMPLNDGTWMLDVSPLDQGTYLASGDPLVGTRQDPPFVPLDCALDYASAGLTAEQLIGIQDTAYAYEVRIFGVADAATLALLEARLTETEPARSTHYIFNNHPGPLAP